jgi:hypothetical protein
LWYPHLHPSLLYELFVVVVSNEIPCFSIEDVIQILIDLRIAPTGTSTIETNSKQQEICDQKYRRRHKS